MPEPDSIIRMHITKAIAQQRCVTNVATESGDFVMSYPKIPLLTIKECESIQNQLHILNALLEDRVSMLRNPAQSNQLYNQRRKDITELEIAGKYQSEDPPY